MRIGEEGTKSLVNSQLFFFPGLPHLTGSEVTYCHVDRDENSPSGSTLNTPSNNLILLLPLQTVIHVGTFDFLLLQYSSGIVYEY